MDEEFEEFQWFGIVDDRGRLEVEALQEGYALDWLEHFPHRILFFVQLSEDI